MMAVRGLARLCVGIRQSWCLCHAQPSVLHVAHGAFSKVPHALSQPPSWLPDAQLTEPQGRSDAGWSAAAWIGIIKSSQGTWADPSGPVSSIPWCPMEPNDRFDEESCTYLGTHCSGDNGGAMVNDYGCHRPLRALCVFPASGGCDAGALPGRRSYCLAPAPTIPYGHDALQACITASLALMCPAPACAVTTANTSACVANTTKKVVLYPQAALSQPQALDFCRTEHGPTASLVDSNLAVLSAAQALVQKAQVRSGQMQYTGRPLHGSVPHANLPLRLPCRDHASRA
jgi:hypothetical protein